MHRIPLKKLYCSLVIYSSLMLSSQNTNKLFCISESSLLSSYTIFLEKIFLHDQIIQIQQQNVKWVQPPQRLCQMFNLSNLSNLRFWCPSCCKWEIPRVNWVLCAKLGANTQILTLAPNFKNKSGKFGCYHHAQCAWWKRCTWTSEQTISKWSFWQWETYIISIIDL